MQNLQKSAWSIRHVEMSIKNKQKALNRYAQNKMWVCTPAGKKLRLLVAAQIEHLEGLRLLLARRVQVLADGTNEKASMMLVSPAEFTPP